ncbi:MAG: hypothetical protein EAY81_11585, partial [Bacteroidetes bacterium]
MNKEIFRKFNVPKHMAIKRKDNDQTLKEAIGDFFKSENMDGKLAETGIIANWEKIVGKLIATET